MVKPAGVLRNQRILYPTGLKKPLRIIFIGESAIDKGGPRQEFFHLVIEQLVRPEYGLFREEKESREWWFNVARSSLINGNDDESFLVGLVLGLAIYNSIILNLRFPLVIWKKLLGNYPGGSFRERKNYVLRLEDVIATFPIVGANLQYLLDYKGDVEKDFNQFFEVARDVFGVTTSVDLIPNGSQIPVTNQNRELYVEKYVDYLLNKSIENQFNSFSKGFKLICEGKFLELFRAEELELTVCGQPTIINTEELEEICEYKAGFSKNHPYIKEFWKLVHSLSQEQKKRLLFFTTGSDRTPIGGLKTVGFIIQRNGSDTEHLPTAMTCYHVLLLPKYSSVAKLKRKLLLALENEKGFGMM